MVYPSRKVGELVEGRAYVSGECGGRVRYAVAQPYIFNVRIVVHNS